MDKILFICEGEKTEKKFCDLIIDRYFIDKKKPKEYVAFGANIYSLYDEMTKDNYLDIIEYSDYFLSPHNLNPTHILDPVQMQTQYFRSAVSMQSTFVQLSY